MIIIYAMMMFGVWSLIFPLSKIALQSAPPVFLTSMRMLLAGVVLLGFLLVKDKKQLKIGKKQIVPLLVLSLCSIYFANVFEFWSMQHLSPVKVCFIYGLSPFLAVFLSYLHFKEKITKKKVLGMAIGVVGMIPVFLLEDGTLKGFTFADAVMLGAVFFSVYGWILLRVIVKDSAFSPIYANGYSMLFGGGIALVHSFFVDNWAPVPIVDGKVFATVGLIVLMTVLSNIICYNWYGYLLKRSTATLLSFCGLFSPIFASLTSYFLVGEPFSPIIFFSTAILLSGLFLIYQTELKQGYISSKNLKTHHG